MILPFWIIRALEIYIKDILWMDCPREQASETFLFKKTYGRNIFHEKIVFCGKRIYFQLFLHITLSFYKNRVSLGQPQYAYDFSKLNVKLCV